MWPAPEGGLHDMECGERPALRLPARQLPHALLLPAAPVHPVRRPPLLPHLPAGLVPLEVLHSRRLADRPAPDGGAVRLRRPAHLRAAGAVCAVCGDLQPPRHATETHQVQPGGRISPLVFFFSCCHQVNRPLRFLSFLLPQVASLVGSSSILFCGLVSNNMENFATFQAFTVLVAVLSCGCMLYTGLHSRSRFDMKDCEPEMACSPEHSSHQPPVSFAMLRSQTWQILTNRDFQLFVIMNFFQVFMLAFFNNFTMIFSEHLVPADVLPPLAKSVMYGAGFICPQVVYESSVLLVCHSNNNIHTLKVTRSHLHLLIKNFVLTLIDDLMDF